MMPENSARPAGPALVALGSNLGDSASIVRKAFNDLQALSRQAILTSSLWRSEPADCPPGSAAFINAVAVLDPFPEMTPALLLRQLKELEKKAGRPSKIILNEARLLDLDLIAFGSVVENSNELTLPHPRAHLRRFVLAPLDEILPDFILPGQTMTVHELLRQLKPAEQATRL